MSTNILTILYSASRKLDVSTEYAFMNRNGNDIYTFIRKYQQPLEDLRVNVSL